MRGTPRRAFLPPPEEGRGVDRLAVLSASDHRPHASGSLGLPQVGPSIQALSLTCLSFESRRYYKQSRARLLLSTKGLLGVEIGREGDDYFRLPSWLFFLGRLLESPQIFPPFCALLAISVYTLV